MRIVSLPISHHLLALFFLILSHCAPAPLLLPPDTFAMSRTVSAPAYHSGYHLGPAIVC